MTSEEFKAARIALKCSQADLSDLIRTPKRTIQDWEAGKCKFQGIVGVCMTLLLEKEARVMGGIKAGIVERIEKKHPGGLVSEVGE
jgi:DNA-binding transcriptional regulator YiaG